MKFSPELEKYRARVGEYATNTGDRFGAFLIPYLNRNYHLKVIASDADREIPWEHVSVSLSNRCPNWEEMSYIKSLFWDDEETVMQLHPPKSKWINNHPYCLHMWRPVKEIIPIPPSITVGFKEMNLVS
jgi:hypothetical protein